MLVSLSHHVTAECQEDGLDILSIIVDGELGRIIPWPFSVADVVDCSLIKHFVFQIDTKKCLAAKKVD